MDDEDTPACRLENPIQLDSLLNSSTTEFSVRDCDLAGDEEEDTRLTDVYRYEDIEPHLLLDDFSSGEDENVDDESIDVDVPFPNLRKKMMNVRDDGKVTKMIVRPGSSGLIPEDGSDKWVVYVHYLAHAEYGEVPFDCTYLRQKKPVKLRLNKQILPGVEIAIRSMRKMEKSRFLIHPDLAYGELGAPPRIPPNATLHFQIELFDFCREEEKAEDPNIPPPRITSKDVIAKAKRYNEIGNKKKKQEKDVNGAIAEYKKGVRELIQHNMADEKEEQEIQNTLIKLYTNLAVCNLKKENYRQVCIAYNDANHDCKQKLDKSVKLNYLSAKALRFLGNFSEAKNRIRKAGKLKPGDEDILKELNELEATIEKTKKDEKARAKKMMGFGIADQNENDKKGNAEDDEIDEILKTVGPDFKEGFLSFLTTFKQDSNKNSICMPSEHTQAELEYCQRVCREQNIDIKVIGSVGSKRIALNKRAL